METIDNGRLYQFLSLDMAVEYQNELKTTYQKLDFFEKDRIESNKFVGKILSNKGYIVDVEDSHLTIKIPCVIKFIEYTTTLGSEKPKTLNLYIRCTFDKTMKNNMLQLNKSDFVEFSGEVTYVNKYHDGYTDDSLKIYNSQTKIYPGGISLKLNSINKIEIAQDKKCFVATACYGDYNCSEVIILRNYRDTILLKNTYGRTLVSLYYVLSPPFAKILEKSILLRRIFRNHILSYIIRSIKQKY